MIFVKLNGNWVHYIRKKTYCQPSVHKKVNNIFFIRYQGQKVRKDVYKRQVKKILDKIESCSVPAFFSGREEHMCNADKFDAFLKKAQKGEKDSIVVYEVHEDGGIGRNKYIFDGQNMYVLYVGSVWNDDEDVISIEDVYKRQVINTVQPTALIKSYFEILVK